MMTSYQVAERKPGVICQGTLWRSSSVKTMTSTSSIKDKSCDFCVLTGVRLCCFESLMAYRRTEMPVAVLWIVGASAWNPITPTRITSKIFPSKSISSHSDSVILPSSSDTSFRLVTHKGTHVYCQAPTPKCRDIWLSTLHAGLGQAMNASCASSFENDTDGNLLANPPLPSWKPPSPRLTTWRRRTSIMRLGKGGENSGASHAANGALFCCSCGVASGGAKGPVMFGPNSTPLPQYGQEGRCNVCLDCCNAQGLIEHTEFLKHCLAAAQQEESALEKARELCWKAMAPLSAPTMQTRPQMPELPPPSPPTMPLLQQSRVVHTSTASRLLNEAITVNDAEPLYDGQNCDDNPTEATNTLSPVIVDSISNVRLSGNQLSTLPPVESDPSWSHVYVLSEEENPLENSNHCDSSSLGGLSCEEPIPPPDWHAVRHEEARLCSTFSDLMNPSSDPSILLQQSISNGNAWIHLPPTAENTKALLKLLHDPIQFGMLKRISPWLEELCNDLQSGCIGVPDFLEELDGAVGSHLTEEAQGMADLKKQAFHLSGDMGTAVKLLAAHALPKRHQMRSGSSNRQRDNNGTKILACILDFFLDLCEQGDLASVAFFWPQFCHIHLRMLPPEHADDVARVEIYEDFLLTIAAHYSVHLALELVWSHTADLEESLSVNLTSSIACRRRRFAVLRFVCELESLIFDFDGGWGGGSVTLGKMLQPTGHQVELLKRNMKQIQEYRKKSSQRLVRSFRTEKLSSSRHEQPPEKAVLEKLRIAKNAEYFSSHFNFTKRLCDIAEKLRFLDMEQRSGFLQQELALLNASGAMGGDPLNKISRDLARVVRVPPSEGHVFRSKERTPVLLLIETVNEGADSLLGDEVYPPQKNIFETNENELSEVLFLSNGTETPLGLQEPVDDPSTQQAEKSDRDTPPCLPIHPSSSDRLLDLPLHHERTSSDMEGSLEDSRLRSPRPSALKRFDASEHIPEPPATPKRDVELLLSSVMKQQLHNSIALPDLQDRLIQSSTNTGFSPLKEPVRSQSDRLTDRLTETGQTNLERGITLPKDFMETRATRKTLGSLASSPNECVDVSKLAPTGDVRREVLNTIMLRGMQGNTIAAGAADSVQRSLKELERQRATVLLMTVVDDPDASLIEEGVKMMDYIDLASTSQKLFSLGIGGNITTDLSDEERIATTTEEDEVMEAIRLLLIQNRVAQGKLSSADAAKVLQHSAIMPSHFSKRFKPKNGDTLDASETPTIDAGDVDPRLVGCGPLPPAVLQALTLWKGEMITHAELLELVKKDIEFVRHSVLFDAENVEKLNENSEFWGRFSFGERWAEKKARIAATSPQGAVAGWELVGVIVKSNDDLRQESFVMQLIELCQEAFELAGLELWVNPYRILATGRTTGVIEMVRNAMSFDALKKRPGYGKGGLREHLQRMTEFTADPGESFKTAQRNFVRSLAAYSLLSHIFLFKDRHNGNLLVDTAGHVIHIDFGFVFGVAPGGSFSLEMSTPFKLTEEMLDVMGGLKSPLFSEFVTLFCCGFLALQSYSDTFLTIVEIMCKDSTFKCFEGRDCLEIVTKLKERFFPNASKEDSVSYALDLIKQATTSYGTRQYDLFQYLSQGIAT